MGELRPDDFDPRDVPNLEGVYRTAADQAKLHASAPNRNSWHNQPTSRRWTLNCSFQPMAIEVRALTQKGLEYLFDELQRLQRHKTPTQPTDPTVGGVRVLVEAATQRPVPASQYTGRLLGPDGRPVEGVYAGDQDYGSSAATDGGSTSSGSVSEPSCDTSGFGSQAQDPWVAVVEGGSIQVRGLINRPR